MDPAASKRTIPYREYRRAFRFVTPYWRSLLVVIALGLFSTLVGLTQPYISRLLIDGALLHGDLQRLWHIASLMVVITVTGFAVNALSSYCYTRLSAESLFQMRLVVFRHLQTLSPRYFTRHRLGDVVSRVNNDIGEVQRVCSDLLLSVFTNILFLVGSVSMMLWMNVRLTLASVCLLPISILALRHYQRRLLAETAQLRQRSSDMGSFLIESIMGMRLIVTSRAEGREATRFQNYNQRFVSSLLSMQMTAFLASALPGAVLTLSTAAVFLYGGKLVIRGDLSLGAFVAFMAYHVKLLAPVQNLIGTYTSLLTGGVSLARVFEILDTPAEVVPPIDPVPLERFTDSIVFDRVAFSYGPGCPVLNDVCFTIKRGGFYALAGASGAGKSTIADLLVRLLDVQGGAIRVDGIDLRKANLNDLRSRIAVVEQSPYLIHGTIRENISFGRPDATTREIQSCAGQAGILSFIERLPNGFDTVVGERGSTLSVGERQRIALARALLQDPEILILDEPTSALDPDTEANVTHQLAEGLRGRTTLVITHRMSLLEVADYVFVLEEGAIVEQGVPFELLHREGSLARRFRFDAGVVQEV